MGKSVIMFDLDAQENLTQLALGRHVHTCKDASISGDYYKFAQQLGAIETTFSSLHKMEMPPNRRLEPPALIEFEYVS